MEITLPSVTHGRNIEITPRNAMRRTTRDMASDTWKDKWRGCNSPHERLKWARVYWQERAGAINGTAKDAAASLGMKDGTYRAYERVPDSSKHTPLDHQAAIKFGRRFGVDWTWLLSGQGTPFDSQLPPAQERVLEAMSKTDEAQQNALADMIEAVLAVKKAG